MDENPLRETIEKGDMVVAPGVFDGLTANIAEAVGFDALYLGGYTLGSVIAASEQTATLTEMCNRAREITHNTDLPLIVDGNAGFGNPSHTYRAVKEYAKTGIDAIHIEDQVYPKRMHYFATEDRQGIKHITDEEEMIAKIHAATDAVNDIDEDILIVARTDAARDQRREFESIESAVDRINAYFDAGADMGMAFPATNDEAEVVANQTTGPMMYVMLEYREPESTRLSAQELDNLGYDITIYPHSAVVVATKHVRELYKNLYETGDTEIDDEEMARIRYEINDLTGLPKLYDIEERSDLK